MSVVDFTKFATGSIPEGEVTVTGAKFTTFDWNGKSTARPVMCLELRNNDGDEYTQYWGIGSLEDFKPSSDGKYLDSVGSKQQVHANSSFSYFIRKLMEVGFNQSSLNVNDIGCLVGLTGRMTMDTLPNRGRSTGMDDKERTVLVFDKIVSMPGEGKGGGAGAGTDGGGFDPEELVEAAIVSAGGSVVRSGLAPYLLKVPAYKGLDRAQKSAMNKLLKDDAWFSESLLWTLDNGVLTVV